MIDGSGSPPERCPCGAGEYSACCGQLHAGARASTALALMRSRYSAFALGIAPYLRATWHPSTRPEVLELDDDTVWRRLQIVDTARGDLGDTTGIVEFRAAFRTADGVGVLHERSRFTRVDGDWYYVDGELLD